jgi:prepilin-type N-terminal cleavage/methylation domain-containing protein
MKDSRGFTLVELLVVIGVVAVLALALGFQFVGWQGGYRIESQVKELHSDLLNARTRAMQRNRLQFVVLTADNYQIFDDANENGAPDNNAAERWWPNPKPLSFPPLSPPVFPWRAIMDTKGLVSTNPAPPPGTDAVVRFDIGENTPDYDCIVLSQTRIVMGKWNGSCVEK